MKKKELQIVCAAIGTAAFGTEFSATMTATIGMVGIAIVAAKGIADVSYQK